MASLQRFAMPAGAGLLALAVACEFEPPVQVRTSGGGGTPAASHGPGPTPSPDPNPSGSILDTAGSAAPSPSGTPGPDSETLAIGPEAMALFVPPPDGSAPLFAATASLTASGAPGAVFWQSSDPGVAQVSAGGLVQAGRAGSAVITATSGSQMATASVTVTEMARLAASAAHMPDGAAQLSVRITDGAGEVLFDGTDTADLTRLGNLTVWLLARSAAGVAVAAGRWAGLTLQPGKLNRVAIPLNTPGLDMVQPGGPGAHVLARGAAFERWVQGGTRAPFAPEVSASLGGTAIPAAVLGDDMVLLSVPPELPGGLPATRQLVLSVGGVPLATDFRLVERLEIQSPPATLSVSGAGPGLDGAYRYSALAFDPADAAVGGAALRWAVASGDAADDSDAGGGAGPAGTITEGGAFTPVRPGMATVAVRSGQVLATASVEVVP